ncbi:response regulator transcription factor [Elizabethkingia sp. JS20170427COW]|uniref:response regulator n=1 Tax=Elizabethkingia sp. JS20170427COW TaxID=2583851 RepID=UPI0021069D95|nr:response regulator transcription factor [Elizabethkingia sp. JS20170427COW]
MEKTFLIADDHAIVRQGLSLIIEDLYEDAKILQTATLAQTLGEVQKHSCNFAILDIQFQDGSCMNILPKIKEYNPDIKILIFSSCEERSHALKYIEAGAHGYLNKLSDEDTISSAIQALVQQGKYFSPIVQDLLLQKVKDPFFDQPLHKLTDREKQVAQLLAEGLGNLEIANYLNIKQNTVSTLKKRIFEKLEITNILDLAELLK